MIAIAGCIFYAIATPVTALLFFFRVSAVYTNSKSAVTFFGLCWLCVAACFTYDAVLGFSEFRHVLESNRCAIILRGRTGGASYTAIALYDTLVFLAIAWQLLSVLKTGNSWKSRTVSFFTGAGMFKLSRALLRDGQLYYAISIPSVAVCISVPHAVLLNLSVSGWAITLNSLTTALPALLACRVLRQLKLKAKTYEAANMPTLSTLSTLPVAARSVSLVPPDEVEDLRALGSAYEMTDITAA
ncbi:hypothetical protein HWV62_35636 [Athelia sp. TMB]|nr:hypothetical protein HWV62_35636 [Athelia sp. TMB]